jgi:hypothetical protein
MIIKDGANPLFEPSNGYPNLLPADNTVADAWGFSFEGSKLSAMTGRNLVLERFTRGTTYQWWPNSWQRFLGYTRMNKAEIGSHGKLEGGNDSPSFGLRSIPFGLLEEMAVRFLTVVL